MKNKYVLILLFLLQFPLLNCQGLITNQPILYKPDNSNFHYVGRIDFSDPQSPKLSGAGSYIKIIFKGSTCDIIYTNKKSKLQTCSLTV